jgi:hypothetical protein
VKLSQARAAVDFVVSEASGPVSVFVADDHGEIVAAATMDGAAPDTRLNAAQGLYRRTQRRALDVRARREGACRRRRGREASTTRSSRSSEAGRRVRDGTRRAPSGQRLPGEVDEQLARSAIETAGLSC